MVCRLRLVCPDPTRPDPNRPDPIRSDPTRAEPTRPDPSADLSGSMRSILPTRHKCRPDALGTGRPGANQWPTSPARPRCRESRWAVPGGRRSRHRRPPSPPPTPHPTCWVPEGNPAGDFFPVFPENQPRGPILRPDGDELKIPPDCPQLPRRAWQSLAGRLEIEDQTSIS